MPQKNINENYQEDEQSFITNEDHNPRFIGDIMREEILKLSTIELDSEDGSPF